MGSSLLKWKVIVDHLVLRQLASTIRFQPSGICFVSLPMYLPVMAVYYRRAMEVAGHTRDVPQELESGVDLRGVGVDKYFVL